jgi:5'(3')-deoxyribonucleotidase
MNKPKIIVDVDDSLSKDFCSNWINWHNEQTGEKIKIEQLTDWDITQFVKSEYKRRIYEYLEEPVSANIIFKTCTPMEDSIEVTKWLQQYFDLLVVSASHPMNAPYKFQWLQRYYPHIPVKNINFWQDKTLLTSVSDWIIEDNYKNASKFKYGLLITRSWNKKYQYDKRFNTWLEIKNYIQRLINLGHIKEVA